VAADPQAHAIGERLFLTYCAQCHGSDARGNKGFPNLTDNDWLYGGAPEIIKETILHGRHGVMPPMGAALGSDKDVDNVANYVLSLSDSTHDPIKAWARQVRRLHGLPRPGGKATRPGRAQPDGQDLAVRRQHRDHHGNHPQGPQQHHAGVWRVPRRTQGARAGRLCLELVQQARNATTK
jgi:cytochrome c553